MNSKIAATILTALLYGQALLGLAGVVTVLLRDRAQTVEVTQEAVPTTHEVAIRL